jgi:hypothetical protein
MFLLWWRMEEENRPRVWVLYGWFSGLMCVGSVFGAVTWAFWMQALVALFTSQTFNTPGLSPELFLSQVNLLLAQAQYWAAAFYVPYAIEFLCLSVVKLLVLHRMADFAVPKGDRLSRRLAVGGRVVMAAVVVGNVAGLCGNVAAAVLSKQDGDWYNAAGAAFAANSTEAAKAIVVQARQKLTVANDAASVQFFCEVAVLLLIIVAFAVVGAACARRIDSAQQHHDALVNAADAADVAPAWMKLRRQVLGTAAFVFVTFLLRAVFSTMNALSRALQIDVFTCSNHNCDPACSNVWYVIQFWLLLTPEFQLIVVLISSPLALLVALWGMTDKRTLQHMRSGRGLTVRLLSWVASK